MPDRLVLATALLLAAAVGSGAPAVADEATLGTEGTQPVLGEASAVADDEAAALGAYDPLFDEVDGDDLLERDPFEGANRWTFAFNEGLDTWLLDPLTRGYQWVVPVPARRGVNRIFHNLHSPVVFANEVLQLRPVPAATTLARFVVNTTLGVVGIFDVAEDVMQLPRGEADFGQTLARYWVPRGPYLVLPLFGPSTARDMVGTVVDLGLDPITYIVGPLNLQWQLLRGSGQGLAIRDAHLHSLDALRDGSVDYYSTLRSAYLQSRHAKELEVIGATEPEQGERLQKDPTDQDSVPEASFSMRSSIAAINASKSSRLAMPENSDLRSASSLTIPSR